MKKLLILVAAAGASALSACGPREFVKGDYDQNVEEHQSAHRQMVRVGHAKRS